MSLPFSGLISLSQGTCVDEFKDGLKECMDPLKTAIAGNVDVNEAFCKYVYLLTPVSIFR